MTLDLLQMFASMIFLRRSCPLILCFSNDCSQNSSFSLLKLFEMCWNVEKNINRLPRYCFIVRIWIQNLLCHLIALNWQRSNCEIWGFHSVVVSLVGRFEDKYPESRLYYLQFLHVLHCGWYVYMFFYCDSGRCTYFVLWQR